MNHRRWFDIFRKAPRKGEGREKMTDAKEIRLTPIANGTVLDHLPVGTALKIIEILKIEPKHAASVAINIESKRLGKKDLLMLENRFLSSIEIEKIGLIAKGATLNIIESNVVSKKQAIELPKKAFGVLKCMNPNCITNKEDIQTKFFISENPLKAKCNYCEKTISGEEIFKAIK